MRARPSTSLLARSTVAQLMGDIARRVEQRHPGTRIDVQEEPDELGAAFLAFARSGEVTGARG